MKKQNDEERITLVRLVLLAMTVFSPNLVSLSWALSPTFKLNIEVTKFKNWIFKLYRVPSESWVPKIDPISEEDTGWEMKKSTWALEAKLGTPAFSTNGATIPWFANQYRRTCKGGNLLPFIATKCKINQKFSPCSLSDTQRSWETGRRNICILEQLIAISSDNWCV